MLENKYYVYAHINIVKNEVFYIGKGFDNRCISSRGRSKYWHRIVNKYGYEAIKLEINLSNEESLEREKYWIKKIGRKKSGGTLINMTDGGDGGDTISNHPNKDEIIKKFSINSKGKNNPNYGSKFKCDEYIKKQIDSNSKKPLKVIDTLTNEISFYKNSKDCALVIGSTASYVRKCKFDKIKLHKRYIIEDKINT